MIRTQRGDCKNLEDLRLTKKENKKGTTVVKVGDVYIGGANLTIIAGPCAVENEEQLVATAFAVKEGGAHILRGGAFKPRTSPYSFQGLKIQGLKILAKAREFTGLPIVTEVISPGDVETVSEYVDILQVGSRNMQNFTLLQEIGRSRKPVLLKRGFAATLEEWLMAAEYIMCEGSSDVILCERGIRTYQSYTRNTLDISAIPIIKRVTHLPIIADPSHATGRAELVGPVARAAVAAGADGLMIEVHPDPVRAQSDGEQSLTPNGFNELLRSIRPMTFAMKEYNNEVMEKAKGDDGIVFTNKIRFY